MRTCLSQFNGLKGLKLERALIEFGSGLFQNEAVAVICTGWSNLCCQSLLFGASAIREDSGIFIEKNHGLHSLQHGQAIAASNIKTSGCVFFQTYLPEI